MSVASRASSIGSIVREPRRRRIAYSVVAVLLALLAFWPEPYVGRAKLLPQDSSSAGLGQILNSLGGQLSTFANLLTGGRPPNDLYLVIGRSDSVSSDVINELKLVGDGRRYATVREAKVSLDKKVDVHLLLGGVVEVETTTLHPEESLALTASYVRAISRRIGALGRQTIESKTAIVKERFRDATARLNRAEGVLNEFRRRNRLPSPETALGTAVSLRTELQARLQAKEVEVQTARQFAGPESQQLRSLQTDAATLREQIARTAVPVLGPSGPNVAGIAELTAQYLNLYRDYRFAEALYDVYSRASEQVAVESLVAETASYIQVVEPAHLDAERHYNVSAIALLGAIAFLAIFTELYVPATGLSWATPAGGSEFDDAEV